MTLGPKNPLTVNDLNRRTEQRAVRDGGVVFATLAAGVDAEARELVRHLRPQRTPDPALIEKHGARSQDDRLGPDAISRGRARRGQPKSGSCGEP
jgi:hypothetical protein